MTPKTIRFTSQADELTVARDFVMNANKVNRLALQVVIFFNLVNVGYGMFRIVGYRDTIPYVFGVALICGLIIVPAVLYRKRFVANEAKGGIAYELTTDERGIESIVPKKFSVAWKDLTSVRDLGTSFVFVRRLRTPIVIPKRAFDDGGAVLWHFLESELVGPHYLVRGSGAPLTITNTRAR